MPNTTTLPPLARRAGVALVAAAAALSCLAALAPSRARAQDVRVREVAVVSVRGTIDEAAARRFEADLADAARGKPSFVFIEIDAEGDEAAPARAMGDRISAVRGGTETIALVTGRAAGTALLVAFSADRLAVVAGAGLGDGRAREGGADLAVEVGGRAREHDLPEALARSLVDGKRGLTRIVVEDASGASVDRFVLGSGADLERRGGVLERETILEPGAPLVLEGSRAQRLGLAQFLVRDEDDLRTRLEGVVRGPLEFRGRGVGGSFAGFLAWAHRSGLLPVFLFLGLLGLLIEMSHPSLVFPGAFGILCFAIALSGGHMAGLTDALDLTLIGSGVALCLLEIFVIPGFGAPGIIGIACLGTGLFLSMQESSWPRTAEQIAEWKQGLVTFTAGTVGLIGGFALISRFLPRTPFLRGYLHTGTQQVADGYTVASASRVALIGKAGTAETDLRPSGKVLVGAESVDAQSDGGWIDRGSAVVVIESHEGRVIVKKAP